MTQQEASDLYMSKAQIKEKFDLNDCLIKMMGPPDRTKVNPCYRSAAPMQLFLRTRVEEWMRSNDDLVQEHRASQRIRQPAAAKAVATKREKARQLATRQVNRFKIKGLQNPPSRKWLVSQTAAFLMDRYPEEEVVTDRAICSHVRHQFSNYEEVLDALKGQVGIGELYEAFKVLACCLIIERCGLDLHPVVAAFGNDLLANDESIFRLDADPAAVKQQALDVFGLGANDLARSKGQRDAPSAREPAEEGVDVLRP